MKSKLKLFCLAVLLAVNASGADLADPFARPVRDNDRETVKKLVKAGADVNGKYGQPGTSAYQSPLGTCLEYRDARLEMIKDLIELGADVNLEVGDGFPPVIRACVYNSPGALKLLLDAGAAPDGRKPGDGDALYYAALFCSPGCLELLLRHGLSVRTRYFQWNQMTALHVAGDAASARVLLDAGADVNAPDGLGRPPAFFAVEKQDPALFELLLARGADLRIRDKNGRTLLHAATFAADAKTFQKLLSLRFSGNDGRRLRPDENAAAVRMFDPNDGSLVPFCPPPLITAAECGRLELVKILLGAGADIDSLAFMEMDSPLVSALRLRQFHCAKFLILAGADVNRVRRIPPPDPEADRIVREERGMRFPLTALYLAVSADHLELTRLLLDKGADPKWHSGPVSLLQTARANHHAEMEKLLLARGVE